MVVASQLRVGMVVRFEGQDYKVIGTEYRPGQGRMSGAMHARLRNLDTGTIWEHAFRSELKLEELPLDKHTLEFLYTDENHCCFMDPESFEQTEIPMALVGVQARFLEAGMRLAVEFVAGRPINVLFPDVLEVATPSVSTSKTCATWTAPKPGAPSRRPGGPGEEKAGIRPPPESIPEER